MQKDIIYDSDEDYDNQVAIRQIKALENILNRLEQDERVIEEMAECIHRTQHCKVLFGKQVVPYYTDEIISHFRKKCK